MKNYKILLIDKIAAHSTLPVEEITADIEELLRLHRNHIEGELLTEIGEGLLRQAREKANR